MNIYAVDRPPPPPPPPAPPPWQPWRRGSLDALYVPPSVPYRS